MSSVSSGRAAVRAAVVLAVSLVASMFVLVGPMTTAAQAAPTATVAPTMSAGAAARYPTYCTHHNSKDVQRTTCVHITKIYGRVFNVVYRDGVRNPHKGSASMTCTATVSKTFTWHVDASVKAEAGAIFAHVSAEISGGISHSVTSSYGSSVTKKVPGHKTMFCDRGIYTYSFKGTVSRVVCSGVNCTSSIKNFSGKAPQRALWNVYIGH